MATLVTAQLGTLESALAGELAVLAVAAAASMSAADKNLFGVITYLLAIVVGGV
jgi:hypothetical protein